jgi:hypothetical protein
MTMSTLCQTGSLFLDALSKGAAKNRLTKLDHFSACKNTRSENCGLFASRLPP